MRKGPASKFTQTMGALICSRMSAGESLESICKSPGMPAPSTVRTWAAMNAGGNYFADYARARELQADFHVAEILVLADTPVEATRTETTDGPLGFTSKTITYDSVERTRLQIDARKWTASKFHPRQYGDRIATEVSGPNGGPVNVNLMDTVAERVREAKQRQAEEDTPDEFRQQRLGIDDNT